MRVYGAPSRQRRRAPFDLDARAGRALAMPVLSFALPRWEMPIVTVPSSPADAGRSNRSIANDRRAPPAPSIAMRPHRASVDDVDSAPAAALQPTRRRLPAISWQRCVALPSGSPACVAVAARLLVGLIAVRGCRAAPSVVIDAPVAAMARELAAEVGVTPNMHFLRSARATMPMAWGIFRPAVLMPAEADDWPAERLRIVLLHELAHVKRRDCLTHLLAQIACARLLVQPAVLDRRAPRAHRARTCV